MRYGITAFLICMFAAVGVQADTVHLTNGDVLTGVVIGQSNGIMTLRNPVLGPLTISMDKIASWEKGAPNAAPPTPTLSESASEGAGTAPAPAPAKPTPAPPAAPAPVAQSDPPDETPAKGKNNTAGLFGTPLFAGWTSEMSAGFAGSRGNSRSQAFNFEFKTLYEDDTDRWLWDNTYFFSSDSGETSQNEFTSALTKDWLVPDSKWFYFANAKYEYDQFEDWKHRAGVFGGVGYEFIKTDRLEVTGRLGAGGTKEFSGRRDFTPEGLVGASVVKWKITDNQTLSASTTIYPALDDIGEYRIESGVEYQVKIDQADGISVKLGLKNEYDSDVAPGDKHNDLKYYGALVYDF